MQIAEEIPVTFFRPAGSKITVPQNLIMSLSYGTASYTNYDKNLI